MTEPFQSWPTVGGDRRVNDFVETDDDRKAPRLPKVVGVGTVLVLLLGVTAVVAFVIVGSDAQSVTKKQYCTTLNKWYSYFAHSASVQEDPTAEQLNAFSTASDAYMQQLADNPPAVVPADVRSAVHDMLVFFSAGSNSDAGISENRFVRDGNLIIAWRQANCRTG